MTNIEKLAAVIKKRMGLGSYTASIIAGDLFRGRKALNISVDQLHGLIEGTHVVVPVEPVMGMIDAGYQAAIVDFYTMPGETKTEAGKRRLGVVCYKAMIKAAQE